MDDLFLQMIDEQLKGGSDFRPFVVGELLEEVRRLRALTEPRPIESAPKDGTRFLAWWPEWVEYPAVCYFSDHFDAWMFDGGTFSGQPDCWWPLPQVKGT